MIIQNQLISKSYLERNNADGSLTAVNVEDFLLIDILCAICHSVAEAFRKIISSINYS